MKRLAFHFDPVSPYAYLAFEALPQALEGCSYFVEYRPVLFAGLLRHHGQKGPALRLAGMDEKQLCRINLTGSQQAVGDGLVAHRVTSSDGNPLTGEVG